MLSDSKRSLRLNGEVFIVSFYNEKKHVSAHKFTIENPSRADLKINLTGQFDFGRKKGLNVHPNLKVAPPRIELGTHGFSVIHKHLLIIVLFDVIIMPSLYPFSSICIHF